MQHHAIVIHANNEDDTPGKVEVVEFARTEDGAYGFISGTVGGGIQAILIGNSEHAASMYLHDEGKFIGAAFSSVGTAIAGPYLFPDDFIVGTTVLVRTDEMGDTVGMTREAAVACGVDKCLTVEELESLPTA